MLGRGIVVEVFGPPKASLHNESPTGIDPTAYGNEMSMR